MSPDQRLDAYFAQNGSTELTPAQSRRYTKKYCHQLARAGREADAALKAAAEIGDCTH